MITHDADGGHSEIWDYIQGHGAELADLLDKFIKLEERVARLEKSTPQARQLQYEADLAAADLAASGYADYPPIGAERHGEGCLCPYCPPLDGEDESPLARRDAYIGTHSHQDVTKREAGQ